MKNFKLTLFALFLGTAAFAQPGNGNTGPVYFTDSEVDKNYVSFGIHGDPLFTQRRIFSLNSSGLNSGVTRDDFPATGGFGYNYGATADFRINSNIRLGIGVGQTAINYRLDDYEYALNGDTALVGLNTSTLYNSFPLRVGFVTNMNSAWSLEIWIPVSYNTLVSYEESTVFNGQDIMENLTEDANPNMWSAGIQVGGAFHITDQWSITGTAQFRYFTTQIIDKPNRPRETPYGTGISLGVRFTP